MNTSKHILASLACSLAFSATAAWADDLTPPPWRGDPGSTFQHWAFNQPGGGPPDSGLNNPYGTPLFTPDANAQWQATDPSGRTGIYFINFDFDLTFEIPNSDMPGMQKELWLQVTYSTADAIRPVGSVIDPATGVPFTLVSLTQTSLGDGFYHDKYVFSYTDCPPSELVTIVPGTFQSPAWIDQVVIDTRCLVPAPGGAAALVGVAGLAIARRRRA